MRHLIPHLLLGLLLCAPAGHAAGPDIPVDSRIRIFTYNPADVYLVPTKYGYQTSIVFARNEEINTVSVGDRSMWQIIPSGNRIFIRPMNDDLTTNMTVITNVREYNFDIKAVAEGKTDNLYVVQFRYPDKKNNSLRDTLDEEEAYSEPPTPPLAPVIASTSGGKVVIPPLDTQRTQDRNTSYTYTGPDALAPAEVYDNGKTTYVVYSRLPSPAPVPMLTSADGNAVVASHRIDGNMIVIRTVTSGFTLKSPSGEITVYNELYHSNEAAR